MLFDVHCHLDLPQFDSDVEEVIKRARLADILMVTCGLGQQSIQSTLHLSDKYGGVFACIGLDPSKSDELELNYAKQTIAENKEKLVAVGEVGLDYYWTRDKEGRAAQAVYFREMIKLADRLKLPLVIHSRDAEKETMDLLEEYSHGVLMHCFSGTLNQALAAASRGWMVSIPTSVAYSKQKQKIAQGIPLEAMVLETDAPFLSPTPGTRNEPVNVAASANTIAGLRKLDTESIRRQTTLNALRFFRLKSKLI